jgi:F0F1-type ATP synthase assembly protein I
VREPGKNPLFDRQQLKAMGLAAGLGCSVVAILITCVLGGILLDRWLETTPLFTLAGVLIGILAAGSQLWRLARAGR